MLGINHKMLALFPMTLLIATMFVAAPIPIFADPPAPCTDCGDVQLPQVFCYRITDIRADKLDPEKNKFTFEFEILNWSDDRVHRVDIAIAANPASDVIFVPTPAAPQFPAELGDGVDENGRPLIPWPVGGPLHPLEDANGDGMLNEGEDMAILPDFPLGDGRLTNDLIPGNQNIPNEFTVDMDLDSPTYRSWTAPNDIILADFEFSPIIQLAHAGCDGPCFEPSGIEQIDLINTAMFSGQQAVNQAIPGELFEEYFVDANGVISDPEVIDNGDNVRDGFVFTVDNFDDGDMFSINWFLLASDFEGGFENIGLPGSGNPYGFGMINFARSDDPEAALPGPVFEGNTGVSTSPLIFFDSVHVVPDPAGMAAEPAAAIVDDFANPDENYFNIVPNAVVLQSQVGGSFIPVDTTSLLLLGVQGTASWLLPVLVSAIGIGIVLVTRKSQ